MYTSKFYVHEYSTVNLSEIYFLKNAKKQTCKRNNHDWICIFAGVFDIIIGVEHIK